MKNALGKNEAARLIARAVKLGFKRSVDVMRDSKNQPWSVQVSLTNALYFPNGFERSSCQIIVSFVRHISGRRSVSVVSRYGFQRKMTRGAWSAGYHINEMARMAGEAVAA